MFVTFSVYNHIFYHYDVKMSRFGKNKILKSATLIQKKRQKPHSFYPVIFAYTFNNPIDTKIKTKVSIFSLFIVSLNNMYPQILITTMVIMEYVG